MHTKTLHHAMPIVATALARKFGVAVRVGGTQARTDGQTLWLPDLPAESQLRPVAWGFLAHEASHVRHTDMTVFQTAAAASPLRRQLLNILEDIRIERAIRREYPGTQTTLEHVVAWMLAAGQLAAPTLGEHPARILTGYLLLSLRLRELGQTALTAPAAEAERVLRQTFPASLVHRLLGLMGRIAGLTSTADAAVLARRVEGLLEQEAESDAEAGTEPSPGAGATEEAAASGGREEEAVAGEVGASDEPGPQEQIRQALTATADDLAGDLFEAAGCLLGQAAADGASPVLLPSAVDASADPLCGTRLLTEAQETSRTLIARLQGLVQASRRDRRLPVHQGRTLIPGRLYLAGLGEGRLFARKRARTTPNTAVHLLVDLSGSMSRPVTSSRRAYHVALEAALALALALDRLPGVSVAVTAFPGESGDEATVSRLLQHGQRPAARAGAFGQSPRGNTPLAQGLWFAAADLLLRPEPRRLILTLTDGEPDDRALALSVIAQCEQAGLELPGLGIQHDVSSLFRHSRVIEAVDDLTLALFGLAERLLV